MSYLSPGRQSSVQPNAKVVHHFSRHQSGVVGRDVDFQRYSLLRKNINFVFSVASLSPLSSNDGFVSIITWLTFLLATIPSHSYGRNVISLLNDVYK